MPLEDPNLIPVEHASSAPPLPPECCAKCRYCTMPPDVSPGVPVMPPICRRYPPMPVIAKFTWNEAGDQVVGNTQVSTFPYVVPQGWCGEFIPRDARMQ